MAELYQSHLRGHDWPPDYFWRRLMPDQRLSGALTAAFDRLYAEDRRARLDQLIVDLSAGGFLMHLALVFAAHLAASSCIAGGCRADAGDRCLRRARII